MPGRDVEFVVIGAGVVGLSAASALARRGREVVVCEQGTIGHVAGGSKGTARIFRLGYDHPGYVRLAMVAQNLWRRLEAESGMDLMTRTGQVTFGDDLDVLVDAMTAAGAPCQRMGPQDVATMFPGLSVPTPAVFEPESGVLAADVCLAALRRVANLEVEEQTKVVRFDDDGRRVRVAVERQQTVSELRASAVVVCAGPWTGSLLPEAAGVEPMPTWEQVAYLAPVDGADGGVIDALPVFVERRRPWFYGLPVRSDGLMKISLHGAGPRLSLERLESRCFLGPLDHPDALDRPDPAIMAELSDSARRVLPGLLPEPVDSERCVYDNSPDGDFVIDRIGNVVIGSGTSGHGFKFGPVLGELLADLATGATHAPHLGSPRDLGRFGHGRLRTATGGGPTLHP
jgi:sarcosine oxidase